MIDKEVNPSFWGTVKAILSHSSIFELPQRLMIKVFLANSLVTSLFLILFQPFQLYRSSFLDLLGVSALTAVTIFTSATLVHLVFRKTLSEKLISYKLTLFFELLASVLVMSLAVAIVYGVRVYQGQVPASYQHLLLFFYYGLLVAPFLIIMNRFIIVLRVLYSLAIRKSVQEQLPKQQESLEKIEITCPSGEAVELTPSRLLFVKAEGNYLQLTIEHQGKLTNRLIRCTLSAFISHLQEHAFLLQCHRSYVVNLKKVSHMVTEQNNKYLQLIDSDVYVPVSRSKAVSIKDQLEAVKTSQ